MNENNSKDCPTEEVKKWALGWSGCHGGDIGCPQRRSIWVCGIEWGGQYHNTEEIKHEFERKITCPPEGYCSEDGNLASPYDRNVLKIITAMCGNNVKNYKYVNSCIKPFVKEQEGFFKMNLFPIAFRNTNEDQWNKCFEIATGFSTKEKYKDWCRRERFAVIKNLVDICRPKLIICFGKENSEDFKKAFFGDSEIIYCENDEINSNIKLQWYMDNYTIAVICPFPSFWFKNILLQSIGDRISNVIKTFYG